MLCLPPYSLRRSVSEKRDWSVFQDFAVTPAARTTTVRPMTIFRAVMIQEMVASVAPRRMAAMMVTPIREIVRMTPIHARAIDTAERIFNGFGNLELIVATNNGAVVQRKTERLLESSSVPGTRCS